MSPKLIAQSWTVPVDPPGLFLVLLGRGQGGGGGGHLGGQGHVQVVDEGDLGRGAEDGPGIDVDNIFDVQSVQTIFIF